MYFTSSLASQAAEATREICIGVRGVSGFRSTVLSAYNQELREGKLTATLNYSNYSIGYHPRGPSPALPLAEGHR